MLDNLLSISSDFISGIAGILVSEPYIYIVGFVVLFFLARIIKGRLL